MLERCGRISTSQLGGLDGSLIYCLLLPSDLAPTCALQGHPRRAIVGCMQ